MIIICWAFGLIITSGKAQGSWKILLVYFIHAQDGSLVALNKKCLYGILNIYILPALFLSAITEMPESIASKLLGSNTVNKLFASTYSSRCVVLPCSFASLKLAHLCVLYTHHIYICLDMVMFHHHLTGKSALWRATSALFSACKIYSTWWILTYACMWAW